MKEIGHIYTNFFIVNSERLFLRDIRLNAHFYEALLKGEVFSQTKTIRLGEIAKIFHPGIMRRIYVKNKKFGVPFLSTSDMISYEAVDNKYVSLEFSKNLEDYIVQEETILISRSGTIGITVLVDKMMSGCAVTEHAIRIVLNDKSHLGLVYTFLTSSIGKQFIKGQKSGAVIDEIYDEDLAQTEIPIIKNNLVNILNEKIISAKENRERAYDLINKARSLVLQYNNLPPLDEAQLETLDPDKETDLRLVSTEEFTDDYRLDAHFYNPMADLVVKNIKKYAKNYQKLIEFTEEIILGKRFKRNYVDKEHGTPFLSGKNIIQIRPEVKYLSNTEIDFMDELLIKRNWTLITCSGTIGRTCFVYKNYENYAASQHILRVNPNENLIDPAYLYCFLSTEYGYHQILRYKYGAVINEIDDNSIANILIAICNKVHQKEIGELVRKAYDLRAEAIRLEDEAQEILTKALTEN